MKRNGTRPAARRGISRIDQESTRTHGWFVRVGFYERKDGTYVPRHTKYFGDFTHGGKTKALKAARAFVDKLQRR